jgi:hypothetical protein
MLHYLPVLLIVIFHLVASEIRAQGYVLIQGTVYNLKGETLPGAHAMNVKRRYGTFTDYNGKFTLILAQKDTMRISMVGYKPFFYSIPANLKGLNYSIKITLLTDTLEISGPIIRPYPATYAEFRQEFVAMKAPEENLIKKLHIPTGPYRSKYSNPEGGLLLPGPFSLLYDNFSKEARQRKKMNAILAVVDLRNSILDIFPFEMLKLRYGCETDEDVDDLIRFCAIDKTSLQTTPHYILAGMLDRCGKEWKRLNSLNKEFRQLQP